MMVIFKLIYEREYFKGRTNQRRHFGVNLQYYLFMIL